MLVRQAIAATCRVFLLMLICGTLPALSVAQELIPLEYLARLPQFANPQIAPDGKHVAVTINVEGEPFVIVQKIMSPDDREPEPAVPIKADDLQFEWYEWANNERLIFGVRATVAYRGDLRNVIRMASIDRFGKNQAVINMRPNDWGIYRQYAEVLHWLPDDPQHILAILDDEPDAWAEPRVHLVDVETGKRRLVEANRKGFFTWVADDDGVVRIGVRHRTDFDNTGVEIYHRATADSDWELLQKIDYFSDERLIPYAFDKADNNILLVSSTHLSEAARDDEYVEAFRYDLTAGKVIGPYVNLRRKKMLTAVQKQFPDREVELVSISQDESMAFYRVYTDQLPSEYYLLNLEAGRLDYVAAEFPELKDYALAEMESVRYAARDGAEIPAFLTRPVDADELGPRPTVVMPHGGPWAHDSWGFDNYAQFLANRGYVVLQPQFRGSTGYGSAHEVAGYGQWGKLIQDDITDGTQWLIDEGIADPERICIVGTSFGGYAAAMGAAKEPDLYRCAISINGVLDLDMFVESADDFLFENINQRMWNSLEEARDYSPYHQVRKIKAPMLLIASERDTVVPKKHSKRMLKALKKNKSVVEYVELPDGEHWRTNETNEITKLRAIESFLARHMDLL
ncbi:MAG: alpha/beta fold hydrolase [Gammaproteobacteria bacterium]|jgi:dipeptidyl aminopeptidase/acylaminoacyl peptidase|nr:alpha/beta fold hydrolase [Gammaproteobacteria bacterium]